MNNTMNITTMSELLESYRGSLDECYSEITIADCTFKPSHILKRVRPYRLSLRFLDYVDSMGVDIDDLEDDLN